MPDGFHVDPDLVGASRFQAKPDEGAAEIVPVIETPVMGDGVFPMIHIDAAFDGGTIFSGDRQIDGAGFFWFTGNNREIFAAYLFFAVMAERNAPLILCLAISRRPVVSRSKRFTARNTKCSPREAKRYARAFASVFHGVPGTGGQAFRWLC